MTVTNTPAPRAIYLPPEVASYLRAASPVATWTPLSRQVYGWIRRGLLAPAFRDAPEASIVVDFNDLVTGQAISLLRAAGISLRSIEQAEDYFADLRSEEHTSELQSQSNLVCRLLLEKKK